MKTITGYTVNAGYRKFCFEHHDQAFNFARIAAEAYTDEEEITVTIHTVDEAKTEDEPEGEA